MRALLILYFALFLSACGSSESGGPVEIIWDRDDCARCRMVLSDRHHAAQIRGGEKQEVFKFDDIGCALTWLSKQSWKDAPETQLWVMDYQNGTWLNGKTAYYVTGQNTPMDYGLGANARQGEGMITFTAATALILAKSAQHEHH